MSKRPQPDQSQWESLTGKFFHTFTEARTIATQGVILGDLGSGHYVVQYFEWISGGLAWYGTNVVALSQMVHERWAFSGTREEMHDAFEYGGAAPRAESGKRAKA